MRRYRTRESAGTAALVRAYVRAWTHRDFDAANGRFADDLEVEVRTDANPTNASLAEALAEWDTATPRVAGSDRST
jgi:hypothetical protein